MASFQPPPSRYLLQAEPLTAAQREEGQKQRGGKLAIMVVLAERRWRLEPVPTTTKSTFFFTMFVPFHEKSF
jgi:hypothetical protein